MNRRDFIKASLLVVPALALKVKEPVIVEEIVSPSLVYAEAGKRMAEGVREGMQQGRWTMISTEPSPPGRMYEIYKRSLEERVYPSEFVKFHEGGVTVDWSEKLDATS